MWVIWCSYYQSRNVICNLCFFIWLEPSIKGFILIGSSYVRLLCPSDAISHLHSPLGSAPFSLPRSINMSSSCFLFVPRCFSIARSNRGRFVALRPGPTIYYCQSQDIASQWIEIFWCHIPSPPIFETWCHLWPSTIVKHLRPGHLHRHAPLPCCLRPPSPLPGCWLVRSAQTHQNANTITVFLGFWMKPDELAAEAATCSVLSREACPLAFMPCLIRQVAKPFWLGPWYLAQCRVKAAVYIFNGISLSHGRSNRSPWQARLGKWLWWSLHNTHVTSLHHLLEFYS